MEFEYQPSVDQDKKPKRLRMKDLEDLKAKRELGEDKLIQVWQRTSFDQPLTPLMSNFSRNAAMIFSPVWKKELESASSVLVLEGPYLKAFKQILDWINLCIEEGNDVKFPEIEDEENRDQLQILLEVIAAANCLKIPEGSLQIGLKKRAPGIARKKIIAFDTILCIYDGDKCPEYTDDLREIAAISIFEAWWSKKLDDPRFDNYMAWLEQIRVDFPQLDADLHEQFEKKKGFIYGLREERKRARDGENSAPPANHGLEAQSDPATTGGWDAVDGAGDGCADGWNEAAAGFDAVGDNDWDTNKAAKDSWDSSSSRVVW